MINSNAFFNCDDVIAIKAVFAILGIILLVFIVWAVLSIYGLPHVKGESVSTIFSNNPNMSISGNNISIVVNAQTNNTRDSNNATANEVIHHTAPTPFDGNGSVSIMSQSKTNMSNTTTASPFTPVIKPNPFKKLGEAIKDLFRPPSKANKANATIGSQQFNVIATQQHQQTRIINSNINANMTVPPSILSPFPLSPVSAINHIERVAQYDRAKNCALDQHTPTNPQSYLEHFSCGHVTVFPNGTTLREFTLIVEENHLIPITLPPNPILYPAWTFNASLPGPTIRVTEGDHVRINVINRGTMPHTLHMHSIHPGAMDGVPFLSGASGNILPGRNFTYDFTAAPYGVYPYHCHANPIELHINRGLYGVFIIDPKNPRPPAHEFVMLLNGYHLNNTDPEPRMPTTAEANIMMGMAPKQPPIEQPAVSNPIMPTAPVEVPAQEQSVELPQELDNDIYSANGVAFYYMQHPIELKRNQDQRIYMVNMLDFEENSWHMHGNLFQYYPSGTSLNHLFVNDMVTLGQGDRAILEFNYRYPGQYMQHAHFDQVAGRGWSAVFEVK